MFYGTLIILKNIQQKIIRNIQYDVQWDILLNVINSNGLHNFP